MERTGIPGRFVPGSEVVAVDGKPFSTQALLGAVQSSASKPLWLDANINGSKQAIKIDYRGELRYPHLERIAGARDLLSALLGTR